MDLGGGSLWTILQSSYVGVTVQEDGDGANSTMLTTSNFLGSYASINCFIEGGLNGYATGQDSLAGCQMLCADATETLLLLQTPTGSQTIRVRQANG